MVRGLVQRVLCEGLRGNAVPGMDEANTVETERLHSARVLATVRILRLNEIYIDI